MFRLQEFPEVLVVEETPLMEERRECYVWVARDPATRVGVYVAVTQVRNIFVALGFLQAIKGEYGRLPTKGVTDGGCWYPWALRRLGFEHEVVHRGIRNYVERWNETLKDRARGFDKYFPCSLRCNLGHVLHWVRLLVLHYNWARPHLSRGNRPPLERSQGPPWHRFRQVFKAALT